MAKARKTPSTSDPIADGRDYLSDRLAALKKLNKLTPGAFVDPKEVVERVSTGSLAVDHITGGGFARARFNELFGSPGSGKSTLAAMACAKAQAQGLYPVYIDIENGLDRQYAERMGFDVGAALNGERGLYLKPRTFEETLTVIYTMVTEGSADIVFVDSVAGLVPESAFSADITELGAIGQQARMMSAALPKLVHVLRDHKTALVFVNQVRANIDTSWTPNPGARAQTKSQGGWALFHWSSLRLELVQLKKVAKFIEQPSITDPSKKDKIPTASLHSAMTFKNKVYPPYRKIEFYIRYDEAQDIWGVDNLQTLLDIASSKQQITTKPGGYYLYKGAEDMNVRGEDAMYEWFSTHPDAIAELLTILQL
ncbi:recombinase RecA [soil metagenome]